MFHFISGTLDLLRPGIAVINAGGVGFKMSVSDNTYQAIAQKEGETLRLYTHLCVKEDDLELFGFFTEAELDTFRLLITVSGVGPKAAMSILSVFTPDKLMLAICTEDKRSIAKANGIGPKTAARIILELHDRMTSGDAFPAADLATGGDAAGAPVGGGKLAEAQEALLVLGYNRSEVLSALQGIDVQKMSVEETIRAALKKLMR